MHSWMTSLVRQWCSCRVIHGSMHSLLTLHYFIWKWVTSLIIGLMHWAFYRSIAKDHNQLTHMSSQEQICSFADTFFISVTLLCIYWRIYELIDIVVEFIARSMHCQPNDSPIDLLISFAIDWFTHKSILSLVNLFIHWQIYHFI